MNILRPIQERASDYRNRYRGDMFLHLAGLTTLTVGLTELGYDLKVGTSSRDAVSAFVLTAAGCGLEYITHRPKDKTKPSHYDEAEHWQTD